jgi:hypothetical protein
MTLNQSKHCCSSFGLFAFGITSDVIAADTYGSQTGYAFGEFFVFVSEIGLESDPPISAFLMMATPTKTLSMSIDQIFDESGRSQILPCDSFGTRGLRCEPKVEISKLFL